MVHYLKQIQKAIQKGEITRDTFFLFNDAFQSLDRTRNMNLFDIKQLKGEHQRIFYRIRKGKYRAIFYLEDDDFFVVYIGKREDVYKQWL